MKTSQISMEVKEMPDGSFNTHLDQKEKRVSTNHLAAATVHLADVIANRQENYNVAILHLIQELIHHCDRTQTKKDKT